MPIESLNDVDFSAWEAPEPTTDFREFPQEWLRYQRHGFLRKLRDLTPEGLVAWSYPRCSYRCWGCGVSSWERCRSWFGNRILEWAGGDWSPVFPLLLGIAVGIAVWWALGRTELNPKRQASAKLRENPTRDIGATVAR